ncbi:MAG: ornithine carbamoyltransferase [Anaerolineae bacterium]|nr:ornithine carbamoyltransferase [Anaerolineae bacterium]MEB2288383.1 ornithine carbamoyltransferase [Anaerolineae bacterium]
MKHFLDLADWTAADLHYLLDSAAALKDEYRRGGNPPLLAGKALAMVFQKPSLRTRVSFEMAMQHVGGYVFYLSPQEIALGKRESTADIARVLGGYVDAIMARTFDHQHILDLARWSPVPVINGLTDYNHPCQAMGDLLTIYEEFGRLEGLHLAYLGDSNNVTTSLLMGAAHFGMRMTIGSPEGYQPKPAVLEKAHQLARGQLEVAVTDDPLAAIAGADVVYTDSWTSMGQEAEVEQRRAIFPPYQVNEALLSHAAEHAIVLHCLPAHRGEEITDEVADGPQSRLFPQAENRLHAQKAILVHLLGADAVVADEAEQAGRTEKKDKKKGKKDKKDKRDKKK